MARHAMATCIDHTKPVRFTFDGVAYTGYAGDTLGAALLANDVAIIGRSFKRHRPRGLLAAGLEECNALVTIGQGDRREVNQRATEVLLYDGLVAQSQNAWPSVQRDVGAINDVLAPLIPAGFYNKTFLWPHWHWYEPFIRRAAGLGSVGDAPDPDRYIKQHTHCDLLIIGSGPAGLSAAVAAGVAGLDVLVLDDQPQLGGSLTFSDDNIDGKRASDWVAAMTDQLAALPNVRVMTRTRALGYYDDALVSAVEYLQGKAARQCIWKIRADQVVLATGAYERPMVFPGNDRPGVRLLSAARAYLGKFGVARSTGSIVYTNNDGAWLDAVALHRRGQPVSAIVDVRHEVDAALVAQAQDAGIEVYPGYAVIGTKGRKQLKQISVAKLSQSGDRFDDSAPLKIATDQLLMSGGWNPVVHLYSQAGGSLDFDEASQCFVPRPGPLDITPVGACAGHFSTDACLASGYAAAADLAAQRGGGLVTATPPRGEGGGLGSLAPWWQTPAWRGKTRDNHQWVDFLHDVTVEDIKLAAREGFQSVEHLKRYTATGMAVDQGKTSNINALAIMGAQTDRAVPQVGTTKFRPPFHPVTIGALAGETVDDLAHRYKRLPVTTHADLGAVFEDHSDWLRPAYYLRDGETEPQAIAREVSAARNGVVLFDSSSLGKIEVHGPDAQEFLNRLYINNVKSLKPGRLRYGMMLNENGTIIDDGVFGCFAPDHYLVTTSSAGAVDIPFWMEEWLQTEWPDLQVYVTPQTGQWATLALSGPKARQVLERLDLSVDLSADAFPHMTFRETDWHGIPLRLFRVSFTGELCFELNIPADQADRLWDRLMAAGAGDEITPLGMEALDVLRVEKGFLEVGVDTDGATTPLDVGWGVPISKKPDDFLGRRSLERPHNQATGREQLVGFQGADPALLIPVGTHLVSSDGAVVGHVTSSTVSPTLRQSVGMALVKDGAHHYGASFAVSVGGQSVHLTLTKPGHYDPKGERLND